MNTGIGNAGLANTGFGGIGNTGQLNSGYYNNLPSGVNGVSGIGNTFSGPVSPGIHIGPINIPAVNGNISGIMNTVHAAPGTFPFTLPPYLGGATVDLPPLINGDVSGILNNVFTQPFPPLLPSNAISGLVSGVNNYGTLTVGDFGLLAQLQKLNL